MTREAAAAVPPRPDPWATTAPREAMRDSNAARVVSLSPSVNLTPVGSAMVPVPYNLVDFAGHDDGYTPTVRFTGQRAMVLRSRTEHVHGDAAGTGGGVASGTVGGITEPIGHAAQVRAEGSHVIRHLDRFWMNNRNTVGEAQFVRDTATYPAPPDTDPIPGSARTVMSDAGPDPAMWQPGAQLALLDTQGQVTTQPRPATRSPPPAPARPRPPSGTGLWGRFLFLLGMGEAGRELGDQAGRAAVGPDGVRGKELSDALTGSAPSPFSPQGYEIGKELHEGGVGPIDGTNTLLSLKSGRPLDFRTMPQQELDALLRQPWPSAEQLARNRQALKEQREEQARSEHERAAPVPPAPDLRGNARVSSTPTEREREDCGIRRHSVNRTRCAANASASHHGMIDFPFRTGTQDETERGEGFRPHGAPEYVRHIRFAFLQEQVVLTVHFIAG